MISRRTRKDIREAREWRALSRTIKGGLIAAACGMWTLAPSAMAAPELPVLDKHVDGTVEIKTSDATMNINQTTDRAIIDWQSFNVGQGATVNFNQTKDGVQNTAAMTLNRITGNDPSTIAGTINSIGSVIFVNPHGILFDGTSQVNAAGIVASTAAIDQDAFMNDGTLKFAQAGRGDDTTTSNNANITVNGALMAAINGDYLAAGRTYAQSLAASSLNIGDRQVVKEISTVGNKIMLVADGDIAVGTAGTLTATTITNTAVSTAATSAGGFTITKDVAGTTAEGTIILRADQNADDVNDTNTAATVKLNNTNADQIQGVNVKVYYNDAFTDGVNGKATADIGIIGAKADKFTMKDYASGYGAGLEDKIADTVTATENTAGTIDTNTTSKTVNKAAYSLINDVYQLQAIDDQDKNTYMSYKYALGGDIGAADTKKWTDSSGTVIGFDPIGIGSDGYTGLNFEHTSNVYYFTGDFTGNGGTDSYGIYDLSISRGFVNRKNYIGLFAATNGSTISDLSIIDPVIKGNYDVGGVAGYAVNSKLYNLTVRKRVEAIDGKSLTLGQANVAAAGNNVGDHDGNIGGVVGTLYNSTMVNCINGSQVQGNNYIGGVTGSAVNDHADGSPALDNCINKGYYSATENVEQGYGVVIATGNYIGGLAGTMGGQTGKTTTIINSYSNGQVTGADSVGGLIGSMQQGTGYIKKSYNSNEAEPGVATTISNDNATQSIYGQVKAKGATAGGIIGAIGYMNWSTDALNLHISEVYNAGNVNSTTYAGGILGTINKGSIEITDSYNADNNTVLVPDSNYSGFTCKDANGDVQEYVYDSATQKWYNASDNMTLYTEKELESIAKMSERLYNTRLAYRDATVTATGASGMAGGIAGNLNARSTLNNTYSAGKIAAKTVGGIAGIAPTGAKGTGTNVFITDQNVTGDSLSGNATTAASSGTLANTDKWSLWQAQNTDFGDTDVWYYSPGSTTPLLKTFMTGTVSATKTQYVYDGSAHLVDTSGITGYYGNGAFSTGADGDNFGRGVNVKNSAAATVTADNLNGIAYGTNADGITASADDNIDNSSFYSYAKSNLWSPQHGYMTDASRGLVITPKKITYDATTGNEKTYGDAVDATDFGGFTGIVQGDTADFTGTLTADDYTVAADESATAERLTATTDAGSYILKADKAKVEEIFGADTSGNYYLGAINDGAITINQRELTYTIGSATKTYGNTTLDSLTGTWNGYIDEDASEFTGGNNVITDDNKEAFSSALTSSGMTKTADVDGDYRDLTVTDDSVFSALIASKNYKLKETDGVTIAPNTALKVDQREVKYTITGAEKTYGNTTIDSATGNWTGFIDEDAADFATAADKATVGGAITSEGMGKLKDVTDTGYDITLGDTSGFKDLATAKNKNYKLATNDGVTIDADAKLTITPRDVTYTITGASKTYGETTLDSATGAWSGYLAEDKDKFHDNIAASVIDSTIKADALANEKQGVGSDYTMTIKDTSSIENLVGSKNYQLKTDGGVAIGTGAALTVTPREVTYEVDSKSKTYGDTATGGHTGKFTDVRTGTEGLINGDSVTIDNSNYRVDQNVDTDKNADADTYTGAITISGADLQQALGENYKLTAVTPGTFTIEPLKIYYLTTDKTYTLGTGDLNITGVVVKSDGKTEVGSMTSQGILTAEDFAALKFIIVDGNGKVVDKADLETGTYHIVGTGLTGGKNYYLGDPADWYKNGAILKVLGGSIYDIIPDVPHYEAEKDSLHNEPGVRDAGGYASENNYSSNPRHLDALSGGVLPIETRGQFRSLSIESTGINVGEAPTAIYHISIAPSSYALGATLGAYLGSEPLADTEEKEQVKA